MNPKTLWGWAMSTESDEPVDVYLYLNGECVAEAKANIFEQNLLDKGLHPTGYCGFSFPMDLLDLENRQSDRPYFLLSVKAGPPRQGLKKTLVYEKKHSGVPPTEGSDSFFFVHIQKTAGTAFKHWMEANFQLEEIYANGPLLKKRGGVHPRYDEFLTFAQETKNPPRFWAGHIPFITGKYLAPDLAYLTFLREPVSRVISHLSYIYRLLPDTQGRSLSIEAVFEEYMKTMFSDKQCRFFADNDINDLHYFRNIKPMDPEGLATAKQHLSQCHFVGITERYDESLEMIASKYGLKALPPKWVNVTPAKEQIFIPESILQEIPSLVKYDLELYHFALGLFEKQLREQGKSHL